MALHTDNFYKKIITYLKDYTFRQTINITKYDWYIITKEGSTKTTKSGWTTNSKAQIQLKNLTMQAATRVIIWHRHDTYLVKDKASR